MSVSSIKSIQFINNTDNNTINNTDNNTDNQLETCEICFETFNTTTNRQIICPNPKCNKSLCLACCKKWLLQEGVAYTCPYCRYGWNWEFIYKNLPINFINEELKKSYAEICSVINEQHYNYLHDIYKYYIQMFKFVDYYYKLDKLHLFVWHGYDNEYTYNKSDKLKSIYKIKEFCSMDRELKHYIKYGLQDYDLYQTFTVGCFDRLLGDDDIQFVY